MAELDVKNIVTGVVGAVAIGSLGFATTLESRLTTLEVKNELVTEMRTAVNEFQKTAFIVEQLRTEINQNLLERRKLQDELDDVKEEIRNLRK